MAILAGKNPVKGRTQYDSTTFVSTGNPCLDFFFHVVPESPVENLLEAAWQHDPLKALKLLCNLRAVRGTGKSDEQGFYAAASWLHKNHPKTLAANIATFAELGCFKDWLEILFRLQNESSYIDYDSEYWRLQSGWRGRRRKGRNAKLKLREKRIETAKKIVKEIFDRDPNFKFLHDCVSDLFAQRLKSDIRVLEFGDLGKISTAAKWCPCLHSEFDPSTLLCESIAKKVFPREEYPEYDGEEEARYANRVMDRLREEVLAPLRKAAQSPEIYIEANDWGSVNYEKVTGEEMNRYKRKFLMHDKRRFEKYLAGVKSGEAKLDSGELLPHQIIEEVYGDDPVAELQWKKMVEEMPKLKNCLAICDVSSKLQDISMSMGLGILVSELNQRPWKGKLITFSENPKLYQFDEGESLSTKIELVKKEIEWSYYQNLQKVFDVLLEVAVKGKLKSEEMVKRVVVFTDMVFHNNSSSHRNEDDLETDYEEIERKFRENGYGDCVPEIVFWKVGMSHVWLVETYQTGNATPVLGNQPGVALVGGYSKNLLSLFSDKNGAILDPEAVMEAAISGEEYQRLLLVD